MCTIKLVVFTAQHHAPTGAEKRADWTELPTLRPYGAFVDAHCSRIDSFKKGFPDASYKKSTSRNPL